MDFFNPEDINRFFEMDKEERREAIGEWLANVAEPWQGNSDEDILARSMVASMHSLVEASFQVDDFPKVNRHILGIWMHTYMHIHRGFQSLAGISEIRKSFEKKDDSDEK
jgi:hypothetical protein